MMKIVKAECVDPAQLVYRFSGGAGKQAFDYASGMSWWVPIEAVFNNIDKVFKIKTPPCGDLLVLVE